MKVCYAAFLDVAEMRPDALEGVGEALCVHHHAENVVACVPVRDFSARVIEVMLEVIGSFLPAFPEH